MGDDLLLAYGCSVLFIAIAGAYVAIRGRFWEHEERNDRETRPSDNGGVVRPHLDDKATQR